MAIILSLYSPVVPPMGCHRLAPAIRPGRALLAVFGPKEANNGEQDSKAKGGTAQQGATSDMNMTRYRIGHPQGRIGHPLSRIGRIGRAIDCRIQAIAIAIWLIMENISST